MRSHSAEHVGHIVQTLEHEGVIEIELLRLGVRWDVVRVGHFEHAPCLPAFDMRVELLEVEALPGEQEWRREVIPQRVTQEISQMQPVPGRVPMVPGKSGAGVGSLLDEPAVATFDPHAVLGENPAIVRVTAKRLHDHARLSYIDRTWGPMMRR